MLACSLCLLDISDEDPLVLPRDTFLDLSQSFKHQSLVTIMTQRYVDVTSPSMPPHLLSHLKACYAAFSLAVFVHTPFKGAVSDSESDSFFFQNSSETVFL